MAGSCAGYTACPAGASHRHLSRSGRDCWHVYVAPLPRHSALFMSDMSAAGWKIIYHPRNQEVHLLTPTARSTDTDTPCHNYHVFLNCKALKCFYINKIPKRLFSIWNHHKCLIVSPLRFISIPMSWVYGHNTCFTLSVRVSTLITVVLKN